MPQTTARSRQRSRTRARVLACARQLFERKGFASTTVRDIASEAGVSTGTVMSVGDKNGLLVQVLDEQVRSIHDDPSRSALPPDGAAGDSTDPATEPATEPVMALLTPFIKVFGTYPELARAYAGVLVSGQHSSQIFRDLRERLLEELQGALTRAGCSPRDAEELATTAYLAYLGALLEWAAASDARTPGTSTSALTDRVRRAIRPLVPGMRMVPGMQKGADQ